jgi:hypothetical protein
MEEGLAQRYFKLINDDTITTDRGMLLLNFYREMFNVETSTKDLILFRRLTKVYGAGIVFKSILDLETWDNVELNNITGLMSYLCKRYLEEKETTKKFPTLDTTELEKQLNKPIRRKKIGDPFSE